MLDRPKISYDEEANASYVYISKLPKWRYITHSIHFLFTEVWGIINIDYYNSITVGIELISATQYLDKLLLSWKKNIAIKKNQEEIVLIFSDNKILKTVKGDANTSVSFDNNGKIVQLSFPAE